MREKESIAWLYSAMLSELDAIARMLAFTACAAHIVSKIDSLEKGKVFT